MIILSAKGISKNYGEDVILRDISFHINSGDKVGVVGSNGAGKTTLLNILAGEDRESAGEVFIAKETTLGYLKQRDIFDSSKTAREEVTAIFSEITDLEKQINDTTEKLMLTGEASLADEIDTLNSLYEKKGGYTYRGEMKAVLTSMAFDDEMLDKSIDTLSGGEKTRLALACMLLKKPDLLFLDEPTNHLDIGTLKWLEGYLRSYRGTVITVSHDRYFLDRFADRIFDINDHRLDIYEGNYSFYAEKKREIREARLKAYYRQSEEIARQEEMIRRMKQRGTEKLAKRARSREKRLDQIERIEAPDGGQQKMKLKFTEDFKSGTDVIEATDLAKSFGQKKLFENVSCDIKRGERICIVGANGIGKTTLLRILLGEIRPDHGRIEHGFNVRFGYYDQGITDLTEDNTLLEEMKEAFHLYTDTEMRRILGRFLFTDDDVFLKVSDLSGGERARLALLKLMLGGDNVLVFDEPTNHLDIDSKEVFEEALLDYPGTVITVTHDRYFLNRIPTRILELERDGLKEYLGRYDYYIEKKESIGSGRKYIEGLTEKKEVKNTKEATREQIREKKEKEKNERRLRREKEALEKEIADLEEEIETLEKEMALPENMTDYVRLAEMGEKLAGSKELLEAKTERWFELSE